MTDLSSDLRLLTRDAGPDAHVEVCGELDLASTHRLRQHLTIVIDRGTRDVLVDMSLVEFCDATALRVLVAAYQRLDVAGRRLRIVNPSDCVDRILRLTDLHTVLTGAR